MPEAAVASALDPHECREFDPAPVEVQLSAAPEEFALANQWIRDQDDPQATNALFLRLATAITARSGITVIPVDVELVDAHKNIEMLAGA